MYFGLQSPDVGPAVLTGPRFRVPKTAVVAHETAEQLANQARNANLLRLVTAYRTHGHKAASLDPLGFHTRERAELKLESFGFSAASTETYSTDGAAVRSD